MVSELAFMALSSNIDWKFLKGLEQRRVPASEFAFAQLQQECGDIALDPIELDELFDQVEFLVSLEFSHARLSEMSKTGIWFWAPVGRFVWKSGRSERLGQFEGLTPESPVLRAGLLGGTPTTAAKAVEAMREHLKKVPEW